MQKTYLTLLGIIILGALPAFSQPRVAPDQLDHLVDRIALYPDPLLAQILTASTFSNQIPDAADYAGHHRYLNGDALAGAIQQDNLPWDPSVVALVPFPSVLDMMASDMGWTQRLGDAVLVQRGEVMDAVQRMRRRAYDYGYLRSGADIRVNYGPYIEILPVGGYIVVPRYDPLVVYGAWRPGYLLPQWRQWHTRRSFAAGSENREALKNGPPSKAAQMQAAQPQAVPRGNGGPSPAVLMEQKRQ